MIFPPEIVAVGAIVMVGVRVIVAVGLAVGVGVGILMIVGVGVGVITVFCCSKVFVISVSCFLRTDDWEYIKMDAEIPTPAKIKRIKVKREDVGVFGKFAGMFAGCGSVLGVKIGSGGVIGVGGFAGASGKGSISLSLKSLNELLGIAGVLELFDELEKVGSSSGVSSNSGSGGVGKLTGGRLGEVGDTRGSWLFVGEGGLGKLPKSSFAMLN